MAAFLLAAFAQGGRSVQKRRFVSLGLLAAALVAGTALGFVAGCSDESGGSALTPDNWREFEPEHGRFTIRIPGDPKPIPQNELDQANAGWSSTAGPVTYRISYRELGSGKKLLDDNQVEDEFDGFRDTQLKIVEAAKRVTEKSHITMAKVSARQFDVLRSDGTWQRVQICILGDRMYRADVSGPVEAIDNVDSQQFFNSLRVSQ